MPSFGWTSSSPRAERHGRARSASRTQSGEDLLVGLLGRELAVAIAVEGGVECPDGVDPGRLERPALGRDPQAEKDGPVLRKEDQVPRGIIPARGRRRVLRRLGGQGEDHECQCAHHPRTSLIGLALGSTSRIGRPLSTVFCLVGSIPRPLMTVASRSGTRTGRSLTCSPSAPVSPIDLAATNPSAGQHGRPGVREMVAAGGLVDLRRPAELAHPDDQGAVEQAARTKVGHQGGPTGVEHAAELLDGVEVLRVRVPPQAIRAVDGARASPRRREHHARPAGGPAGNPGRTGSGRRRPARRRAPRPGRTPWRPTTSSSSRPEGRRFGG